MVTKSTLFRRFRRGVVLSVPAILGLVGQAFAQCPTPTISVTAGSTTLCGGQTVTLRASSSTTYLWSNGATTQEITTGSPGTYTVQNINGSACTSAASAGTTVTVNNPFNYALPGSQAQITGGIFISPANPTADDQVTITIYPNSTCPSGSGGLSGSTQVRWHGGVQFTSGGSTFQNGVWHDNPNSNFTQQSNGTWTKTFVPRSFFGIAAGVPVHALTFVLNGGPSGSEWNKQGKSCPGGNNDIIFQLNQVPNLASSNSPITSGQTLNLTGATITNGTYAWTGPNGFSSSSQNPSITNAQGIASGNYYLTVTSSSCVKRDTVEVLVGCTTPATPTISSSTGSFSICNNGFITLTSSNTTGTNYWSNGATGRSITVSSGGIYYVYNILNGCQSATSDTATIAADFNIVTSASSTGSRSIATGVTMYPANPTANDLVTIVVDPALTCGSGSLATSSQVRWHGGVKIGRTGGNFQYVVSADGTNTKSYFTRRSDGKWTKSFVPRTFFGLNATDSVFALTFVMNGGSNSSPWDLQGKACTGNGDIIASIDPTIPQLASSNTPVNPGSNLNLTAKTVAGASYSWTGPNGFTSTSQNPTITAASTVATGDYTLTITSGSCTSTQTLAVLVGCVTPSTPVISASGSTDFCSSGSVTLTSTVGPNYLWSNGARTRSITVNQTGDYTVNTFSNACTSVTSNTISVNVVGALSTPIISASRSLSLCAGDYVVLTSSYSTGNMWSNGATSQSIMVSNSGSYSVIAISSGCTTSSSATSVVTVANAFSSHTGSSSTTLSTGVTVSPQNATADDFITITIDPTVSCPVGSNGLATSSQVRLHGGVQIGSNGSGFQYVVAADGANTKSYFTLQSNGTWTKSFVPRTYFGLNPTDSIFALNFVFNGGPTNSPWDLLGKTCSDQDFRHALNTTNSVANASVNGPILPGGTLNFTTGSVAGATYRWTGPLNYVSTVQNPSITSASASRSGAYFVTTTVGNCSKVDSVTASVGCGFLATPSITANGPTTFCAGNTVTLTSAVAAGYLWSNGATSRTITVTASGSYSVKAVNGICTTVSSNSISVTVNPLPTTPVITASGPLTIATGSNVVLTAPAATFYIWSNGTSSQNATITTAGTYTVRVVNNQGCTSASSLPITITTAAPSNVTTWNGTSWSNGDPTTGTNRLDVFVAADLTINSTSMEVQTMTLTGGNVTLTGTMLSYGRVNTGSYAIRGSGTVKFVGTIGQTFQGNYPNVAITTNTSLTGPTTINGILSLMSGTLSAGSFNWLSILPAVNSSTGIDDFTSGYTGTLSGNYTHNVWTVGSGTTARQVGSPVVGASRNFNNVSNQQNWSEGSYAWSFWTPSSNSMVNPGTSFLVAQNGNTTAAFTGTISTGTINVPITRTALPSTSVIQYGFNALANPYPSTIDWTLVNNVSGNAAAINGTAFIWKNNQFVSITRNGVSSSALANKYLVAGQGFLVRKSTNGTGVLSFNNSVRLNTVSTFVRNAALPQSLRLQLSSNATAIADEALIYGNEDATTGIDELDAEKVVSPVAEAPSLFINAGQALSTCALPIYNNNETRVVSVSVIAPKAGTYTLNNIEQSHFPTGTKVMIEDKSTGVFTSFDDSYSFNAQAGETRNLNIHFTSGYAAANNSFASVYASGQVVNVAFSNVEAANSEIVIFDAAGRVVSTSAANGNMNVSIPVNTSNGIYMVCVRGNAGNFTSKVYIGQ